MGREVKRVPIEFSWPLGKIWPGYQQPRGLSDAEVVGEHDRRFAQVARFPYCRRAGRVVCRERDNLGQLQGVTIGMVEDDQPGPYIRPTWKYYRGVTSLSLSGPGR